MQLLGTGTQRAGKTSRIQIGGGTFLAFASWECTVHGEDLGTVNFESYDALTDLTYDEGIIGVTELDWRCGGDWDAGAVPMGDPPGLFPRDDLTSLAFIPDRNDLLPVTPERFEMDYARVRSSKTGTTVKGKVTFDCSGKNNGRFRYPVESLS